MDKYVSSPAADSLRDKPHRVTKWELRNWQCPEFMFRGPDMETREEFINRLGQPSRLVEHGGREWTAWESDAYTVYVSDWHVDLDVPESMSADQAAEAYLWDMGLLPSKVLTRQEHKRAYSLGYEAGKPHAVQYPNKPKEDLKRFVLDYCDGQVFCDHMVRDENVLGIVFMAALFTEWSPAKPKEGEEPSPARAAWDALPQAGEKPGRPKLPDKPPEPGLPDCTEPAWETYDSKHEREIASVRETFGDVQTVDDLLTETWITDVDSDPAVLAYRAEVDARNQEKRAKWEATKAEAERLRQAYRDDILAWEQACSSHDDVVNEWREALAKWEVEDARASAAREGFLKALHEGLGVIYEYYNKAGPRAINGYPTFFSNHILSRADWERCLPVIRRELQRRDDMEF